MAVNPINASALITGTLPVGRLPTTQAAFNAIAFSGGFMGGDLSLASNNLDLYGGELIDSFETNNPLYYGYTWYYPGSTQALASNAYLYDPHGYTISLGGNFATTGHAITFAAPGGVYTYTLPSATTTLLGLNGGTMTGVLSMNGLAINWDASSAQLSDGSGNTKITSVGFQAATSTYPYAAPASASSAGGGLLGIQKVNGRAWIGDGAGAVNATKILIEDATKSIGVKADDYTIKTTNYPTGGVFAVEDTGYVVVTIGDVSTYNNGTVIVVDDNLQTITFTADSCNFSSNVVKFNAITSDGVNNWRFLAHAAASGGASAYSQIQIGATYYNLGIADVSGNSLVYTGTASAGTATASWTQQTNGGGTATCNRFIAYLSAVTSNSGITFTFPTAFTATPPVISNTLTTTGLTVTLSASSVKFTVTTGNTSTGWYILEGF